MSEEAKEIKPKVKRKAFTDAEINYIRMNYPIKTDKEIAKILERSCISIKKYRLANGLFKDKTIAQKIEEGDGVRDGIERSLVIESELRSSNYFTMLEDILTPIELEFYIKEWVSYCNEVDTLMVAEKRTLDELILIKIELTRLRKELIDLQLKEGGDPDEIYDKCDGLRKNISLLGKQYASLADELKLTRKQRLDGKDDSGFDFIRLVEKLQQVKHRRQMGDFGSALKLSSEKKKEEWRKDKILLDSDAMEKTSEEDDKYIKENKGEDKDVK